MFVGLSDSDHKNGRQEESSVALLFEGKVTMNLVISMIFGIPRSKVAIMILTNVQLMTWASRVRRYILFLATQVSATIYK